MTTTLQLDTAAHQATSLMAWLASRDGALERAGVRNMADPVVATTADSDSMRALFAPLRTSSGYAVNDRTAMLISTVFACLSKLGGAVSQLPVHQYRGSPVGDRDRVEPSPLWWLLNEQPAPAWTAASWKEWIVRCVGLRGDQVTEIVRAGGASQGGRPVMLRPHHPDAVNMRVNPASPDRLVYDIFDVATGKHRGLDQDDVLHFSGFGFDGLRSLSVIHHAARNAIGNALAAADYTGRTIGEGAMPQIALTYPNKLAADQAKLLRDSFVATYGGTQGRKLPLILTEGGTAKELSLSPVDMDLLASRRFEKQDICEAFGVPPIMIGDSEKTSSWGTGVEQITLGFVRFTLKPMLRRWQEELNRKLFRQAGQFLEFDLDELVKGDSKTQAESDKASLGGPGSGPGWASVNEVRRRRNLAPLEGAQWDAPYWPPAKASSSSTEPNEPTEPEGNP